MQPNKTQNVPRHLQIQSPIQPNLYRYDMNPLPLTQLSYQTWCDLRVVSGPNATL